jgi:hypothetical protein
MRLCRAGTATEDWPISSAAPGFARAVFITLGTEVTSTGKDRYQRQICLIWRGLT